ncbi:transcriptional regulator [Fulvivirgaceae bacterium BMA10]|uniref:Transcriptional regulator n=1 Tax=Splendidivirga corallicola TaxID=3051826 RepID=A0ABT8KIA3_9BACT|nr:transcriptional regulator [Fulvivirgaceae bacterium BMA10]
MKNFLDKFNKAFESRIRLGIMSALIVNDYVDFNTLKDLLSATDGNLASHLKTLEKLNFVEMKKEFIGRKPNTQYKATEIGKEAFQGHLNALENLIKNNK